MEIIFFPNAGETAKSLAKELSIKLSGMKLTDEKILLLLSGGSAFKILDYVDANVLSDNITIAVLDERYDPTNKNNNFIQLTKTKFYRQAKGSGCVFIDTSVKKNQTQEELAAYFENALKNWKKQNPSGKIAATIGMGADGHIAGIMPFPEDEKEFSELFCATNWTASYDATGKNPHPYRITTTITFIKQINLAFGYACGEEKRAAFNKIVNSGPIAQLPAQALKQIKNLIIYTDIDKI